MRTEQKVGLLLTWSSSLNNGKLVSGWLVDDVDLMMSTWWCLWCRLGDAYDANLMMFIMLTWSCLYCLTWWCIWCRLYDVDLLMFMMLIWLFLRYWLDAYVRMPPITMSTWGGLYSNGQNMSPWYNRNGWLGVKHQVTYLARKCLWLSLNECSWCSAWGCPWRRPWGRSQRQSAWQRWWLCRSKCNPLKTACTYSQ